MKTKKTWQFCKTGFFFCYTESHGEDTEKTQSKFFLQNYNKNICGERKNFKVGY